MKWPAALWPRAPSPRKGALWIWYRPRAARAIGWLTQRVQYSAMGMPATTVALHTPQAQCPNPRHGRAPSGGWLLASGLRWRGLFLRQGPIQRLHGWQETQ